ncbi:N-6 DNA methylase [Nocardia cyriacigeorgica]|nr:N-6 DNA methylase [Nocardia cyriacigeorgica]MBF6405092.1 N-6 DNA methylase [Nocardia cyriacigeorgica]
MAFARRGRRARGEANSDQVDCEQSQRLGCATCGDSWPHGLFSAEPGRRPPPDPEDVVPQQDAVPVTLAEIARLAGVGRAAVSNWRRRHGSFPAPIGGTDVSPHFSLVEVESWLREQGKLDDIGTVERLWPRLDNLGDRNQAGLVIAAMALRRPAPGVRVESVPEITLGHESASLVRQAMSAAEHERSPGETFEYLLGRWLDVHVRQITTTPRLFAELIAAVAVESRTGPAPMGWTVLDPACGSGTLLAAASATLGTTARRLIGTDLDPVLAAVTAARLTTEATADSRTVIDIASGDSLLADPRKQVLADLVLCYPPFGTRDWGHEVLATDPRWRFGLPPRGEVELAWVQHVLSRLSPGGAAVVVMPPAAASRKAGRHIRSSLIRSGGLHAVIAMPAGVAPPHSVALHLWVLRQPNSAAPGRHQVHLVDATSAARPVNATDWARLTTAVVAAIADRPRPLHPVEDDIASRIVAAAELMSGDADLTPARHIPSPSSSVPPQAMATSWSEVAQTLSSLEDSRRILSSLDWHQSPSIGTTSIGELIRAGVLDLHAGQAFDPDAVRIGPREKGDLPALTVPDLMARGVPRRWMAGRAARAARLLVTEPNDVVVAGVTRAFTAWVEDDAPTVLGPQLYVLRTDPERLDPWFLAGCLRAPSNGRQAGTHTSSAARIDVRKLRVLQLPIDVQRRYGAISRRIADFERDLESLAGLGASLIAELSDRLAAGLLGQ